MTSAMFGLITVGGAIALFLTMVLFIELGRRLGMKQRAERGMEGAGIGVVDAVVYSLLSLLIGFMFSGATGRFDHRRNLIIEEASTISTAWQRIDALPIDKQAPIRDALRHYVEQLIASNKYVPESAEENRRRASMRRAESDIWSKSMDAVLQPDGEKARMLLLPSLNEMFDVVERGRLGRRLHPPAVIFVMLGLTTIAASLFAGYAMSSNPKRNWLQIVGVAATISTALYVIIELEFPRVGIVQLDSMDRALTEVLESME
jgi:hypothetical protein